MLKGTFYLMNEPDLLELLFQQYGDRMAFRGGPAVMQEHADKTLQQLTVYLAGYPGPVPEDEKATPIVLELVFADGDDTVAVEGRLMDVTAKDVADFLDDTDQVLDETRLRSEHGGSL